MKANELRIGNWYHWYAFGKNYEYQVEAIDLIQNYENFEPIALTEEWLVKFGFTLRNRVDYESNCGALDLEATDAGFLFDSRIIIKHVHQLQNLYFAMAGTELELK
jgi:hypothetical protein